MVVCAGCIDAVAIVDTLLPGSQSRRGVDGQRRPVRDLLPSLLFTSTGEVLELKFQCGERHIRHPPPPPAPLDTKHLKMLTGSALIKALKAPKEDPNQRKIDLATAAWNDANLLIPRKAEVLADWVLEAWTRSKPGPTSPLLDPKYHQLLIDVYPSCPVPPSAQIGLLSSFVQSVAKAETCDEELAKAVGQTLPLLLRGQKAEAWAEQWGKLVDVLAKRDVQIDALRPVVELVCEQLLTSLAGAPNPKKVSG